MEQDRVQGREPPRGEDKPPADGRPEGDAGPARAGGDPGGKVGTAPPDSPAAHGSSPGGGDPDREKRAQFFAAAEPLFERYGYRKTTVEEICRAAGASKRTFYDLFNDKLDLFMQYAMDYSERVVRRWEEQAADIESAVARFDLYLAAYLAHFYRNPIFREVFLDPANISIIAELDYEETFPSIITGFSELVEYGMARGEFRRQSPVAVTWIIHALMDGLFLVDSEMHVSDPVIQTEEFTREVRSFILHGLGAAPGEVARHPWPPETI